MEYIGLCGGAIEVLLNEVHECLDLRLWQVLERGIGADKFGGAAEERVEEVDVVAGVWGGTRLLE